MLSEASIIDRMQLGDHVSLTFGDEITRDRTWAAYVRGAVRQGHKLVYCSDGFPVSFPDDSTTALLAEEGIEIDRLVRDGQVEMHGAGDVYLSASGFDPDGVIAAWRDICSAAMADGYAGLRAVGDMTWAADPAVDSNRLECYEAQVNQLFVEGRAMGLCLYDRRRFPRNRLFSIAQAHPATVDLGAGVAGVVKQAGPWEPLLRICLTDDPRGLRLEGEADLANRAALQVSLDRLPAATGADAGSSLDLTALRFIDVPAARAVLKAAVRLGGLRIFGAQPVVTRVFRLLGADSVPGLVIDANHRAAEGSAP